MIPPEGFSGLKQTKRICKIIAEMGISSIASFTYYVVVMHYTQQCFVARMPIKKPMNHQGKQSRYQITKNRRSIQKITKKPKNGDNFQDVLKDFNFISQYFLFLCGRVSPKRLLGRKTYSASMLFEASRLSSIQRKTCVRWSKVNFFNLGPKIALTDRSAYSV